MPCLLAPLARADDTALRPHLLFVMPVADPPLLVESNILPRLPRRIRLRRAAPEECPPVGVDCQASASGHGTSRGGGGEGRSPRATTIDHRSTIPSIAPAVLWSEMRGDCHRGSEPMSNVSRGDHPHWILCGSGGCTFPAGQQSAIHPLSSTR